MNPFPNKIVLWALVAQQFEGYAAPSIFNFWRGTRSWRNKNPLNLKKGRYTAGFPYTGVDSGGFLIFLDYPTGIFAACTFLVNACNGEYDLYDPAKGLVPFYGTFDTPSMAAKYASYVATHATLDISAPIKTFLS